MFLPTVDALDELRELGRRYGGDPLVVQAGGGNTSVKVSGERMWVKASGLALKHSDREGAFVEVDVAETLDILEDASVSSLPATERDDTVKSRLMAARTGGGGADAGARPSLETFLHALLPWRVVVHTHPVYVNALSCSKDGGRLLDAELGSERVLWVPYAKPGYSLGLALREALSEREEIPAVIVLANHGLVVGGDDPSSVASRTDRVLKVLDRYYDVVDGPSRAPWNGAAACARAYGDALRELSASDVYVSVCEDPLASSLATREPLLAQLAQGALYPDHVVYLGRRPLILGANGTRRDVLERTRSFIEAEHDVPRFAVVPGAGVLVSGRSDHERACRVEMLAAHAHVLSLMLPKAEPLFLSEGDCRELLEWEWEQYRSVRV